MAGVADVLHSAAEMCETKAAEKNVTVVVDCPPGLAARINAPLLEQAVVNLIDNAVKCSPAGTSVRIDAEGAENGTVIRVSDQGCGIPSEHLSRLSSGSTGWTKRVAASWAAPGWGWRSSSTSWRHTAGSCVSRARSAREALSPSISRLARSFKDHHRRRRTRKSMP